MTTVDDVARFVARLAPEAACDSCISRKLALPDAGFASQASHELAGSQGFERFEGACSLCDDHGMVLRRL